MGVAAAKWRRHVPTRGRKCLGGVEEVSRKCRGSVWADVVAVATAAAAAARAMAVEGMAAAAEEGWRRVRASE